MEYMSAFVSLFLCFCVFQTYSVQGAGWGGKVPFTPPSYSTELETSLRNSLFTNYSNLQRPNKKVDIEITLNLLTINSLDIKGQQFSISAYFTMFWVDSRLRWITDTTYSNIPFLFSNEVHMWRPAIVIENSIKNLDVISAPDVLMRITSQGFITWTPGGIYETHCESDVTYYPLDKQKCEIVLSTWAYTASEVYIRPPLRDAIVLDFLKEHGEWELIETTFQPQVTKREKQSFSRATFTFTLRRRLLFHILNTLFPVVLMAFLTSAVFKLPADAGEKIGLSLTTLLAYAVYLSLISETIPQTSISASLLTTYLATILFLSAMAVILTIIVLAVHFTPEEKPIPSWLYFFSTRILGTIVCWKSGVCCRRQTQVAPADDIQSRPESTVTSVTSVTNVKFMAGHRPIRNKFREFEEENDPDGADDTEEPLTWKEIALILDKFFFCLYVVLIPLTTGLTAGILFMNY